MKKGGKSRKNRNKKGRWANLVELKKERSEGKTSSSVNNNNNIVNNNAHISQEKKKVEMATADSGFCSNSADSAAQNRKNK